MRQQRYTNGTAGGSTKHFFLFPINNRDGDTEVELDDQLNGKCLYFILM